MSAVRDTMMRAFNTLHRGVFTASNGRLMGKFQGMPVVLLETTGRKTGKKRSTMLTSPAKDNGNPVIVASYGGAPKHPTWFLNLQANPDIEVTMEGRKRRMRARVATKEEKDRLWPEVVRGYKGYGQYQQRTTRDIPLVILEPQQE
jgi:deazaflavin-dependent oxidoreductase (nitroreductase family)